MSDQQGAPRKLPEFDPSQHLSKVKGQDYLEVKWRIAWFRSVFPAGSIETQMVSHANDRVIVSARVEARTDDGEVRGIATGFGSETFGSFGNYIEKAETKAIGRALGALGFGTQFCDDFADDVLTGEGIADAPVQLRRPRQQQARQTFRKQGQRQSAPGAVTEGQVKALYATSKALGWSNEDLRHFLGDTTPEELTFDGASAAITDLNAMKAESR